MPLFSFGFQDNERSLCWLADFYGYSKSIEAGSSVLNSVKDKKERFGRMLQMHSNSREDIKVARAGDIIAVAGLKDTTTGDTLCDSDNANTRKNGI